MNITRKKRIHLFWDALFLAASIILAAWLFNSGLMEKILFIPAEYRWLAIFIAGIFLPFIFTTASAALIIFMLAKISPLYAIVLLGGLGAVFGDFVVFRFSKKWLADDLCYLLNLAKHKRWLHIIHLKIFRWIAPFFIALIIATPLPDEFAVAFLGLEKITGARFVAMTFIIHAATIAIISMFA